MPGRLFLTQAPGVIAGGLSVEGEAFAPRLDIAPGETLDCIVPGGALVAMRWGMIPVGRRNARGRPVMETIINARSETVFDKTAFDGVGRAVVPVSGWYEWTGQTRRKTRWRIRPADDTGLLLAAITDVWNGPGGVEVAQVALVTCEPNADVVDYHHRMPVILSPGNLAVWLQGMEEAARPLLVPAEAGRLVVEQAPER